VDGSGVRQPLAYGWFQQFATEMERVAKAHAISPVAGESLQLLEAPFDFYDLDVWMPGMGWYMVVGGTCYRAA